MTLLGATRGYALILVWFGWVFAGMDYTLYAYALPVILQDLHISIPTAGIVFFLSLQGTFLGSLFVPILADYFGRRGAMMGNILLYALATGFVALAQTAFFLTLVRFLVTFGVGGEQPVGATYISEQWAAKTRARAMGFMQSGFAIGTLFATLLEATVAARSGWRPLFVICAVPALLVVLFRIWLPESKRWEATRRDHRGAVPRVPAAPIAPAAAVSAAGTPRRRFPMAA
ncbi:MAG: MFS transporter, partial [Candidatus Dormiibacterota bacterium]